LCRRVVEWAVAAREHSRVVDDVVDHRFGVRPVHVRLRDETRERLVRRRELARAWCRGRGADEHERQDAIGEVEGEDLRERTAGRNADDMRGGDSVRVQYTGGIGDEIGAGISRVSGLVGHRSTGVAVVVADHEPARVGEHPAERLLPPEHRRGKA
jgi:hypothetical protein